MPYGEKLKLIKKEKGLTNMEIHKICDVPLSTVTRVFDEKNFSGNFETFVSIARGLGISLDELAGLRQPDEQPMPSPIIETINSYSDLLKEKDDRIKELKEEKLLERRERQKITGAFVILIAIVLAILALDIFNNHF